jgi:hypothetical protein
MKNYNKIQKMKIFLKSIENPSSENSSLKSGKTNSINPILKAEIIG